MLIGSCVAQSGLSYRSKCPTNEMILNLKTAKALGLDVPLHLQQLAEVIE
jgi:hypothetical protein